jgi:hypothetical protein
MIRSHFTFVAQNCGKILKPLGLVGLSFVAFVPISVQAGHLFTQSTLNTPTWIQVGQGISIDQYGTEPGSGGTPSITLNFTAPSSVPADADTTNNDWYTWSAGDVLEINLPLANATYNYTIAYDTASPGTTCAYDYCGSETANVHADDLLASDVVLPSHLAPQSYLFPTFDSTDPSFAWSVVSIAGEFSLSGYRIYTNDGTINGTGAGLLDQSSVVSASQAQGGSEPVVVDNRDQSSIQYRPVAQTVNPDLFLTNIPVCESNTWLSGMSVVGNGKITHYVDYKHKDECFKYEVKILPKDVVSRNEAQVFKHLGSNDFDVYKYRPS